MSKQRMKKEPQVEKSAVVMPSQFPTPDYDYQQPVHGSDSVRFTESDKDEASDAREPCLQNVKLVF